MMILVFIKTEKKNLLIDKDFLSFKKTTELGC